MAGCATRRRIRIAACWLVATGFALGFLSSESLAAGRKVDVGGHKLKIYCSGRGEGPTVLLESGAGDAHGLWSEVQPAVARFARVCSYDRAGLSKSEPGPLPRTSGRIVGELEALLQGAGIQAPLVLVGHSFGGLSARLFASNNPDRVVGLLLVDATHEDYPELADRLRTPRERARYHTMLATLSDAARSEIQSLPLSAAELRRAGLWPAVPTIVMTAGDRRESPVLNELWYGLQWELASAPHVLHHVIAENSGHDIPFERPQLVVDSIRQLVGSPARARPKRTMAATFEPAGPAAVAPATTSYGER